MKILTILLRLCLCIIIYSPLVAQVDYQEIKGENLNIGNILFWTTTSEVNNAIFVVEKSLNEQSFFDVFELKGAGTTSEINNYSYLDATANEKTAYYRIKQIAIDGTFSYSNIIQIQQNIPNNIQVQQISNLENSKDEFLYIYLDAAKAGILNYTIENETLLFKNDYQQQIDKGTNTLAIDFSYFPKGDYSININMEGEIEMILLEKFADPLIEVNLASKAILAKKY